MLDDRRVRVKELKEKLNAVILAHYYQDSDIQDLADYVGDSLGLSQEAAKTNADVLPTALRRTCQPAARCLQ